MIEELSRSLKSQMKYADKLGCDFAVIIGDDELEKGVCKVREMKTSSEEVVRIEGLAQHIKSKI